MVVGTKSRLCAMLCGTAWLLRSSLPARRQVDERGLRGALVRAGRGAAVLHRAARRVAAPLHPTQALTEA